jgi:hypothetical protein
MKTWPVASKMPKWGLCEVREMTDRECTAACRKGINWAPRSHGFVNLFQRNVFRGWCGINFAKRRIDNVERIGMKDLNLDTPLDQGPKNPSKCMVHLTTSYWHDDNGIYVKTCLRFMKRQCKGYNVAFEDCQETGAAEVFPRIKNLHECRDGIYELVTCNEWAAWETPGCIEDYDYKLIPYDIPKH